MNKRCSLSRQPRQSMFGRWATLLACLTSPGLLRAQIVVDPAAASNRQPVILQTANGITQVNIQTPNAAGLSHNVYRQFDVPQQGVILNNSTTNMQTQLGGWVQNNPLFSGGSARTILNEVNSSNPSLLKGFVEVAGTRAEVIVANPSGIQVNGGGFINASRATLTTGQPVVGNTLEGFRVSGGQVVVEGNGLDVSAVDYADIIARSVQVNAGIWANQLKLTTGSNQVDAHNTQATPIAGSGPVPQFALDVALLGGMYAGKIMLIGTEAGLGVRNAGNLGALAGDIHIASNGQILNRGSLKASGDIQIDTTQTLDTSGTVYAGGALAVQAGEGITLQTGSVLASRGDATLRATASGATINTAAGSTLAAGLDAGNTLLASGDLALNADGPVTLAGMTLSGGDTRITAQGLDHRNGTSLARRDTVLDLANGEVDNRGGLFRAGGNFTLAASALNNAQSAGSEQGIEAQDIALTLQTLNNAGGRLVASRNFQLDSQGSADNRSGLISAGQALHIRDTAATRTLTIGNTLGTLVAGQSLAVTAARLSGDGILVSQGDLEVNLAQDFANSSQLIAASTLHLATAGTFTNRGQLDGSDTRIDAATLNNLGTGLIQGDTVSIAANTVNNLAETRNGQTHAGTLAARQRLDIGASTLNNRDGALIYSLGNIAIGGSLDSNRRATGNLGTLTNSSATVQADGDLDIRAGQITNQRTAITTAQVAEQGYAEYALTYWGTAGPSGSLLGYWVTPTRTVIVTDTGAARILAGGNMNLNASIRNDMSDIMTGGNITFDQARYTAVSQQGQAIQSEIGASYYCTYCARGGELTISGKHVFGKMTPAVYNQIYSSGAGWHVNETLGNLQGMIGGSLEQWSKTGVSLPSPPVLGSDEWGNTYYGQFYGGGSFGTYYAAPYVTGTYDLAPARLTAGGSISGNLLSLSNLNTGGPAGTPRSTVPVNVAANSGTPLTVPGNALYSTHPETTAPYLVESDSRFTNYRSWLSSDYMFAALNTDPATIQKRLGDGFYEQKVVAEQITQLTGRRFMEGYASQEAQFQALMIAGVSTAQAFDLRPGIALTAEQVASLTQDIVWMVEREVTLADGSMQKALVPQVYLAQVQAEQLNGGALIAASNIDLKVTGDITNQGTLTAQHGLSLAASNIGNEGRMAANDLVLTATQDITNVGGVLAGQRSASLAAGRDVTLTTTTTEHSASGTFFSQQNTQLDRVAKLEATAAGAQITVTAGRDVNLNAAQISNAGAGSQTTVVAGNDLNLNTVQMADAEQHNLVRGEVNKTSSSEAGTSISAGGNVSLVAGNNLTVRAATVDAQGDVGLSAGNDLNLTAGQATSSQYSRSESRSSGFFSSHSSVQEAAQTESTAQVSRLSGQNVSLLAGNDVSLQAARVSAEQTLSVSAGNDIKLLAAQNSQESFASHSDSDKELLGVRSGQSETHTLSIQNQGAALTGNTIVLSANHNIDITAASLQSTGDSALTAGNDIAYRAAVNVDSRETQTRSSNNLLGLDSMVGFGFRPKNTESQTSTLTTTAVGTILQSQADIVSGSGNDTLLEATQIKAGGSFTAQAGGQLALAGAKELSQSSTTSKEESLLWQKATAKGSVTETLKQTQIEANATNLAATGGVTVQIPVQAQIETLAKQPGMGWMADLAQRQDVNWQQVNLAAQSWNYTSEGLTPTGALLIAIAVTAATAGSGAPAAATATEGGSAASAAAASSSATVGSMALRAGYTALMTQAAISLANNKGDIGKTLTDLGKEESVRSIALSMATAGALEAYNPGWTQQLSQASGFTEKAMINLSNAVVKATMTTAIQGGKFEENLGNSLKAAGVDSAAGWAANNLGAGYKDGEGPLAALADQYLAHKVAHALVGCAGAGAKGGDCTSGALGAAVGEAFAEMYGQTKDGSSLSTEQQNEVLMVSKMVAAATAGLTGSDPGVAVEAAQSVVVNNFLFKQDKKALAAAKAACGPTNEAACTQARNLELRDKTLNQLQEKYAGKAAKAEVKALIKEVSGVYADDFKKYGVDANDFLLTMANMESTLMPSSGQKDNSSFQGLYQFSEDLALNKLNIGNTDASIRLDPVWSTAAAAKNALDAAATLTSKGVPVTAENLYIAHQQGTAGFVALFNASSDDLAGSVLSKFKRTEALGFKSVAGNLNGTPAQQASQAKTMTAGEFLIFLSNSFNSKRLSR